MSWFFVAVILAVSCAHAPDIQAADPVSVPADASYPEANPSYPGSDATYLGSNVTYTGPANNAPTSSDASYSIPIESAPIPPGMEIVRSGDVSVVVPKGSQLRKMNDMFIIESPEEYAARKFEVVEHRLDQLEKDLAEMKKELKQQRS